mmetsp:Transcript_85687/g.245920  ORF Transcript_85687/g.245920 Transcript_85687/m.245920 type:complete len:305 (+) Transcript_85687:1039-1953(+)
MPVPSVQRRRIKGQRDQRLLLVAGQGLEERGVHRQLRLPLFPEGHFSQELVLCPRLEFTTPLKLALVEVPDVREAIGSSLQILFHGTEDADVETVAVHLVPVLHGVREGPGRDEVHADLAEDLEAIDLGVRGAAVGEVADERDVDGRVVPPHLLQQRELVHHLAHRVCVPAVAGIQEGRPRDAELLSVQRQGGLQPAANTLKWTSDDEYSPLRRIDGKHLHGIGDRLVLLEGRRLGLKLVYLHSMVFGSIPEGLARTRGALHEHEVHGFVVVARLLRDVSIRHNAEGRCCGCRGVDRTSRVPLL